MSNFKSFLEEQMKSEEFRREYEALASEYELVLRGDVDPRNLCYPIKMDGTEYNDYERGYNDGVIAAYWLTRNARKMEAEPVVHAHRELSVEEGYGVTYTDLVCSRCKTLCSPSWKRCPVCEAKFDEEVAE